jgi:hypothetical protein
VVKLVHILHTQISADGKLLEHYHVLDIARRYYDMQLVTIELDQQCQCFLHRQTMGWSRLRVPDLRWSSEL